MPKVEQQIAEKNISLYKYSKIFTKRVFVPLMAVYFIEVAGFNLKSLGLLAAFHALVCLFSEIPTGVFADKFKRVTSIRLGAFFLTLSSLLYVLFPTLFGVFSGQLVEALGFSFVNGALEALIHDSLVVKGDTEKYSKILSRGQSIALIINAILVALIPMTYSLNKRLPFLIGTVVFGAFFVMTFLMKDIKNREKIIRNPFKLNISYISRYKNLIYWGVLFGIISAAITAPPDFTNLALKNFGLNPAYLGWVYSLSSIFGAFIGYYIHKLNLLKAYKYAILDGIITVLPLIFVIFRSLPLLIIATLINISFWRYRRIIYQDYILTKYETNYKATVISALSNIEQVNLLWIPIVISMLTTRMGLTYGLFIFGLSTLLLIPFFAIQTKKILD